MSVDPTKARPVHDLYNDIIEKGFIEDKKYVECMACGKMYPIDSEDFISIWGNVMVGMYGGIIGNNFDEDGKLFRIAIFCRNLECFPKSLYEIEEREISVEL